MEQDYYRILGIREDASEEEIKKRYRILAKKYHPDTNPGDREAEQKFKEAGIAYAIPGDPKKRREYDQMRRVEKKTEGNEKKSETGNRKSAGFDYGNPSAGFEQFFGFRPGNYEKKENQEQKKKVNPIDTTELFEKFMGIKR